MKRLVRVARWIGSLTAIAAGLVWLQRLGEGDLGSPPLSPQGVASWLEHRDTAVVLFALLRLVAISAGWYVLMITAIGGAASALQLRRITALVNCLTIPFARGVLSSVALLGVVNTPSRVQPESRDSMVELSPEDQSSTTIGSDTSAPNDRATLHVLPNNHTPEAPSDAPPASSAAPAPVQPANAEATNAWVVQRGECFWSIAAEHLADLNGGPVGDREVAPYWRDLVELNRSRLVNPSDADLLFAGQEIELPAVTPG